MATNLPSLPATMRAIFQDGYGGPEILRSRNTDIPRFAPDEVLVEVHAAGLDRGTVHLLRGTPYLSRLALGFRRPKQPVPGLDLSGVVVAKGGAVTRLRPGDPVFGVGNGSFAEYTAAKEAKLIRKPDALARQDRQATRAQAASGPDVEHDGGVGPVPATDNQAHAVVRIG